MLIKTERLTFRPLCVSDASDFYQWFGSPQVTKYSLSTFAYPQSLADIEQWLRGINQGKSSFELAVCCAQTNKLLGYAGITSISQLSRSGEYFILIGDVEYWGRGLATEITRAITHYGFNTLGLHRIELTAFSENFAAIKAYEKSGYQHEGVLRDAGFRGGRFLDKVQMAALSSDWQLSD
ncbi:MAG: GNAT family N-acetyltransferase [Pseudomonadales bacterium]|nr:GNAT family N-acetyltransferase [Pseudomonadales bacterium]NRA16133.1 GNAT family N-acetyltransferase [Oceanospirillaceae bacterium]